MRLEKRSGSLVLDCVIALAILASGMTLMVQTYHMQSNRQQALIAKRDQVRADYHQVQQRYLDETAT
ncbi:MAG: hypothetical protein LBT80_03660 [Lactobacillaceae bacterium]|jgi:type II secretory pathway component PulJ|nr:hypothetical protein [Lactobacillaceae bacterium]